MLDLPYKFDTLLEVGSQELTFFLELEMPTFIQLKVANSEQPIFITPEDRIEILYQEGRPDNKFSVSNSELGLTEINEYYKKRFSLLNIKKSFTEAYQPYFRIQESVERNDMIDALTKLQLNLLKETHSDLPEWFTKYEKRILNI